MEANPNLTLERAGPWGGRSRVPPRVAGATVARGPVARVLGAAAGFGCNPAAHRPAPVFPSRCHAKPSLLSVRTTARPWEE